MRSDDIRFLWKFERRWKELKDLALIPKRNRERTELFRPAMADPNEPLDSL